jgi:hypothetical protein
MTSLSQIAAENQMFTANAPIAPAESPGPAAVIAADEPQPSRPAAWDYQDASAPGSTAEELGAPGEAEAGTSPDVAPPDAAPQPSPGSPSLSDGTSPAVLWPEIQATFVDDPRACLELAAQVTGDSADALTASIQEQQHTLLSAWQHDDTSTEDLRVVLQHYRTFWNRLEDITRAH